MPQPFTRKPNQGVNIDPRAISGRSEFAALIGCVANYWSRLEHVLSMPFALLLAGKEQTALRCYNSLFEPSLRKTLFLTAAREHGLSQTLIEEFEKLSKEMRKLTKMRNAVVHGYWGIVEDTEDFILLCEPNAFSNMIFEAQSRHLELRKEARRS